MEVSERSKKDKVRCSSNEDGEMMGGGSEGEEEFGFPSNSSRKRFKLNGKVSHALSRANKKKRVVFCNFFRVILSNFMCFEALLMIAASSIIFFSV